MREKIYKIKEIFYTLQGEGAQAGRAAVFCRFTGCNLWTGRERDRPKAICQFCDTDFIGTDGENGGKYTAAQLAKKIAEIWKNTNLGKPYVVCTGGEPLLQLDKNLCNALHAQGFEIAVETNGTVETDDLPIDWVCVSPKAGAPLVVTRGQELKLVFPQTGAEPMLFADLDFPYFYLQPMDVQNETQKQQNLAATLAYCLENPQWRMSLQTHKILEIP
ncbi:MAG: 7-carboxy-7-deazaguanine synthase [Bacteroidota bacterium]